MRNSALCFALILGIGTFACNDQTINEGQNESPIAEAGDSFTVLVNESVNFDAGASIDPDGSIVNYAWDFGDGSSDLGLQVNYAWDTPGEYTVTLTVTDNDGATGTDSPTATITVEPYPGQYALSANPSTQDCLSAGDTTFVATNVDVIVLGSSAASDWHWETVTTMVDDDNDPLTPAVPRELLRLTDPPGVTGQIVGDTFTMSWSYDQLSWVDLFTGMYTDPPTVASTTANNWTGTFIGDGTIETTLQQNISTSGLTLCILNWNISGVKIGDLP